MGDDIANVLGGAAASGYQQAQENRGSRFLQWLGANYGGLTDSFRDIACIFRPETCQAGAPGQQPTVIVQDDGTTKTYFIILGVLVLLVLVVILLKR